jgi:hypothetical protein
MSEGKTNKGTRNNEGKLKWNTFPRFLIKPLIEVAHFCSTKYSDFNFLKGLDVIEVLDSLERHLEAVTNPEESDYDLESKCHHLGHVAWNSLVALYMIKTRPDLDTRYKKGQTNEQSDI